VPIIEGSDMDRDDFADAGRDADIGARSAGGHDPDIGASTSGGDADDAHVIGSGQATPTGDVQVSKEEAENADIPREGTPDDLKLGKRRTVGLDEDTGAGMADMSGIPGSTTGAG
jgi:hypothetical protein